MKRSILLAAAGALAWGSAAPGANAPRSLPVGACINMGNQLENVSVTARGGARIEAEDFARIRAAGFTTVRIPVRWSNKTGEGPDYRIDPKWMARVTEVVDQALAADLNVILNDHHFEDLDNDPAANSAKLAAIWAQVAPHFASRPTSRLWFEIENEPHEKLTNAILNEILAPALEAIRASNPTRPVVIGGDNWSGIDSLATLDLPDDPNVYPTFHYYEPFDFTHQGAGWVKPKPPALGRVYGSADDAQRLVTDTAKIRAYVARTGLIPFMGETGAYDAHIPLDQRVQYTRAVHDAFAPLGVGICGWAYTNTFPYYDHQAKRWLPGLRGAAGLPED
jgi:endoglucanase